MSAQLEGIKWVFHSKTAAAVWDFERIYRESDYRMPEACRRFFDHIQLDVCLERPWSLDRGGILFFSDHTTALDGFAMSMACPDQFLLRRVIFAMTGWFMGREFRRRNLLVYPKGSYRNLLWKNEGLWQRLIYFATHRWGPFCGSHTAVRSICETLHRGEAVSLLPSGTIGIKRWRSGIGSVLLDCAESVGQDSPWNVMPLYAAPIYLDWAHEPRRVTISSPGLIRFETLLRQAGPIAGRDEMTAWLQRRYEARSWVYDISNPTTTADGEIHHNATAVSGEHP